MYFFKRLYFIQYKPLTPKTALSHTENLTPKNLNQKGKISMFFTTLMYYDKKTTIDWLEAWRRKHTRSWLGNSVLKVSKQSVNTRKKLLQRKWLMRTYINPEKLNLWSPDTPDTCWKCSEENRRSVSLCGDCKKPKQHCCCSATTDIVGMQVHYEAKMCVLGVQQNNITVNWRQLTLMGLCIPAGSDCTFNLCMAKRDGH